MEEISQTELDKLLKYITQKEYLCLVEEFYKEIDLSLRLFNLKQYKENKKEVLAALHTLKGSSASLGFYRLHQNTADFEELLKKESPDLNSDHFVFYLDQLGQSIKTIKYFFNDKQ